MTDFGMNLLLLLLTAKLLKNSVSLKRLLAAAALGAVLHEAELLCYLKTRMRWTPLAAAVTAVLMQKTAFRLPGIRRPVKAAAIFYGISFLMAGAMQCLNPGQKRVAGCFFLTAVSSYGILLFAFRQYSRCRRKHGHIYPVRLYIGEKEFCLKGLVDTGNSLTDPWFHKPVSIVEQRALESVDEEGLKELKIHMIPYSSIGKPGGVLMGIVISRMVIEEEEWERTVEKPVLALCRERIASDGRYQMILHEDYMLD